jgi:hypothetical protein
MNNINRRTFVKGVLATSIIASIPINLSANSKISTRKKTIELSGNTFITLLTNNLKSQLAYCTFGCLKKLATF